jgi:YtkA-like protein
MSIISSTTISRTAGTIRRFPLWVRIVGVIVIVALVVFAVITLRMNYIPNNLDTSMTLMSEHGNYQVSYVPGITPVPVNQIQSWTIRVTTPDGQPIEDATITVEGGMPQHGHGLPTVPQVTKYLGDGQYQVEGMKFHMPGWWVVKFEIVRDGSTDSATFNLMLN